MQNEVDALLQQLQQEAAKRKRRTRWINTGVLIYVCLMGGLTLITWWATGKPEFDTLGKLGWMSWFIVAATAVTRQQKAATRALAQFDDLRSVGPLAEALAFNDRTVQQIAEARLIALLPRLQASDRALLNADQRKCLHRVLGGWWPVSGNIALVLAILKAFEQVGDSHDIPPVEKLAAGEGKARQDARERTVARKFLDRLPPFFIGPKLDARVRTAASECLVSLRQRAEQERASQTYLRAADAAAISPEVLLRPASGVVAEPPEQLLRAGIADNQSEEPQQDKALVRPVNREDETKAQEILRISHE